MITISRRRFMQAGAAAGAMLAWPIRAFPFSQSVMPIHKFKVELPGLVPLGSSTRGIPVLGVATGTAPVVFQIEAAPFTQDLLGAASPGHIQKLWGYNGLGDKHPQYLGGVIVAERKTPVRLEVTNKLPNQHILPVDKTLIDPLVKGDPGMLNQNKITVHLHGGFVFWQYDGGPFSYFTPNGLDGPSFLNPLNGPGTAVYEYPNDQSARTIWYHDHAYALTRTNVYAGLASAYLITDPQENNLITSGLLPGDNPPFNANPLERFGIPLVVQDKTFWDGPSGNDPTYPSALPAKTAVVGDLWYPHIYEGGLDPNGLPVMVLPVSAGGAAGNDARWGSNKPAAALRVKPSAVPEFFSDTILVNGAPYPFMNVEAKRYRFRFINASQARFYNLQLYVGEAPATNPDGITLGPVAGVDPNGNVILKPTNDPGPAFVQIANEAGFLPEVEVFSTAPTTNTNSNRHLLYNNAATVRKLRRRTDTKLNERSATNDPTFGNVREHNLLMAPAERPDVIIDFAQFEGKELILYNDAPAPFPGGDIRNDYFVITAAAGLPGGADYNDHHLIGGAGPTTPGQGPDSRILMKFIVGPAGTPDSTPFDTWLPELKTAIAAAFKASQPAPFTTAQIDSAKTLDKTLGEDFDEFGRLRQYLGNTVGDLRTYLDFPSDVATVGQMQVWRIFNTTADTHPMHFHLVNVQVVRREQWAFDAAGSPIIGSDGKIQILANSEKPVDLNEKGWKETVRMNPGEVTTVAMRFDLPPGTPPPSPRLEKTYGIKASEYVWHCHILEHEEHDMMRPLVVLT